jgi:hypothetical protein
VLLDAFAPAVMAAHSQWRILPASGHYLNMEAPILLFAAVVLVTVIAIPFKNVVRLFKHRQSWEEENGHDRAERREYEWYWIHKKD